MYWLMHSTAVDVTLTVSVPPPAWDAPSLGERDRQIRDGLPLVKDIAERLRRRYGLSMPFEDLCGFGVTGLITATGRFDASRGASFSTFAHYRIRGAILDGLRRSDRQYGVLHRRLAAEGRPEHDSTVDAPRKAPKTGKLRRGGADFVAMLAELTSSPVAWCARAHDPDLATPHPDDEAHHRRIAERVRHAIASLPARQLRIVELHYYGGESLAEVAVKLGISRPWAYRLHDRALKALKLALAELADEIAS